VSGGWRSYWRAVAGIIRKDLRLEMRTREAVISMGFFSILVTALFGFALDARRADPALAPGMLWIAFSFAGVLGLGRSFAREREDSCLILLILCPVDRSAVYLAKTAVNLLLLLVVEALTLPVFAVLLRIDLLPALGPLLIILLLGTLGFASAGTLLAALAGQVRARDLLLPLILYPLWIPLLLAAVRAMTIVLDGLPLSAASGWLRLMGLYNLVFLVLGFVLFEHVVEE
jgi:heme exporter protein B